MKLATYRDGSRDGQLVVVSRDLGSAHYASGIAQRMQAVLDDWNFLAPQLQDLYDGLNQGKARHAFAFDPRQCMAPLPRACQRVDGWAYPSHVGLELAARGATPAPAIGADPPLAQGASDDLLGPCEDIVCASEELDIDFEAEVAVITGDLPMGATPERALDGIRLLVLANRVSLRKPMAAERARGLGSVQGRPTTAFSPVAVTLDEAGSAWDKGRLHLVLQVTWNGRRVGMCDAGQDMRFHFGQLIAHLCATRRVRAGSIVGGGAVSNKGIETDGRMQWPRGYSCIAEKRAMETVQDGTPSTAFLRHGDTVRIEMKGRDGQSLFGAMDQAVAVAAPR